MNSTRRFTLAAMLGAIAAGIGSKAFAQGHGRWHGGPMDPADLDRHVERMLKHLYVEIDATEEQKQRLEPIVKQAAKDLQPIRQNLHGARRQAIEILSQDKIDTAALESLRQQQIKFADDASRTTCPPAGVGRVDDERAGTAVAHGDGAPVLTVALT